MLRGIEKEDWDRVHQLACDVVNASGAEDDVLTELRTGEMLALLEKLRGVYGDHPSILATIGDFLDEGPRRRAMYDFALKAAIEQKNVDEVKEIRESKLALRLGAV